MGSPLARARSGPSRHPLLVGFPLWRPYSAERSGYPPVWDTNTPRQVTFPAHAQDESKTLQSQACLSAPVFFSSQLRSQPQQTPMRRQEMATRWFWSGHSRHTSVRLPGSHPCSRLQDPASCNAAVSTRLSPRTGCPMHRRSSGKKGTCAPAFDLAHLVSRNLAVEPGPIAARQPARHPPLVCAPCTNQAGSL